MVHLMSQCDLEMHTYSVVRKYKEAEVIVLCSIKNQTFNYLTHIANQNISSKRPASSI